MALWHWYPKDDRLSFSPHAAELFGIEGTHVPTTTHALLSRLSPPDRARLESALEEARRGTPIETLIHWPAPQDRSVVLSIRGARAGDGDDALVYGTLSAGYDNDGLTDAELAKIVQDRADIGVMVVNERGVCMQANAAALRLLDADEGQLVGKPLAEWFAVDSNAHATTWQRSQPDGTALELTRLGAALRGLQVFTLQDISERRHTEKLHALLAAIVDSSDDAIVGKNLDGIIQFWNSAAERMFGYRPEEAISKHITLLIPPDRHQEEDLIIGRIRRGERVEHYETVRRAKDGRLLNISLSVSPIIDRHGTVIGASKIARDISKQKQIEAVSRSNRELLTKVVEAAPIAVLLTDENGLVQLWNSAATRIFGWSAEEMSAPDTEAQARRQERLVAELRRAAVGDATLGVETEVLRKDGTTAEVSLWSTKLESPSDAHRTIILAADISDRRRAHRALREQEQRLHTALRASRTGTFRWSARTNELQWDESLDRLFGLPPGRSVHGLDEFLDWLHPEDRDPVQQHLHRCAQDGSDFEMDLRVMHSKDGVRWIYIIGQTFLGSDGRPDYMTGACVDITHRKHAEQALRESETRFRTLADNIAQFAWMADGEGWIFWYNKRWFEYTGTTLEQMQGWGWRDVHHPDHVDRVVEKIRHCFANGTVWEDTFPLRGADGSYRWFLSRAVPIRDAQDRVTRWFGTNTDITERREMEETLKEADRRKDAFLATLAHELRNPLAPIMNGLELLQLYAHDSARTEQIRDTMRRQTTQLVRLVDDLLEVSRVSRNKVQLRLQPVSLQEVVRNAMETVDPLMQSMAHRLTVALPQAPIWLRADPTRLAQVIANLLNNAAKYTDPGGQIEISAEKLERSVTFRVSDNGVGIPGHMLDRIFDMFTQTSALESGRSGLGIGLTLVKALVELHDGTIHAYSAGLGQGSEFVVTLPLAQLPDQLISTTSTGERIMAATSQQRILVVDDNEDAAVSTAMLLEAMGNEVLTAYDGEEALGVASDFRPQVILLDLGMPKLNGYEAARRLRQESWGKEMILIALTGWGQDQDRQRTRDAGFDHHLVKPVDPTALRNLLAELDAQSTQRD